jgi:glycerol-3-phosphate dehydrogenase
VSFGIRPKQKGVEKRRSGLSTEIFRHRRLSPTQNVQGGIHAGEEDGLHFDLLIIGGGINGTGIARDAALRGLKVLLLEKSDFGAGTSAYSSRLIHGGLRYLANLEFDLVRESLRERQLLLKNAPHLVQPLPMAIPVYKNGATPLWQIEMGMWFYDALSWGKPMPPHRLLTRAEFLQQYPGVNSQDLQGGPVFYDAQAMLPERLCVENAMAAFETGCATLLNHAQVEQFEVEVSGIQSLTFQDLLTGSRYTVSSKVYVNAAGPWVDEVLGLVERKPMHHRQRIGGTKGTHIVVNQFPRAPETALYTEARADGRPFFILPWRNDTILIGTTDTHYEGSPDDVLPTAEEINYLLCETNYVLPQAHLTEKEILYAYAGVRPLPLVSEKKAGKISRKHWIVDHRNDASLPVPGLLSIIGGKLTTYRNLAQETVDYAVKHYLRPQNSLGSSWSPSSTKHLALPGGEGIQDWQAYKTREIPPLAMQSGLSPEAVARLLDLYGSRVHAVLALLCENPAWQAPLSSHSESLAVQVVYAVRVELACTVEDVLLRRLGCGLDADLGFSIVEPTARLMAQLLDWSEAIVQSEIQTYKTRLLRERKIQALASETCSPISS